MKIFISAYILFFLISSYDSMAFEAVGAVYDPFNVHIIIYNDDEGDRKSNKRFYPAGHKLYRGGEGAFLDQDGWLNFSIGNKGPFKFYKFSQEIDQEKYSMGALNLNMSYLIKQISIHSGKVVIYENSILSKNIKNINILNKKEGDVLFSLNERIEEMGVSSIDGGKIILYSNNKIPKSIFNSSMKEKLAKSIEYKSKGRWVVNFSHRSSFYEFVKFIRDVSGLPIYSKVKGGLGYNLSMENPVQLNELLESLVVLVNLNGYEIIAQDDTFVVIDK